MIACFRGTNRRLKVFTHFINSLHSNIKFTSEIKSSKTIRQRLINVPINKEDFKNKLKLMKQIAVSAMATAVDRKYSE